MRPTRSRAFRATLVLTISTAAFAARLPAQTADEILAAARAATEKYASADVALAEGYLMDPSGLCVTGDMVGDPTLGAMGVHYFHPGLLGITAVEPRVEGTDGTIDWATPEVLVYEPGIDGAAPQLVAVEYLVFESGWTAAGNTAPPTAAEQAFFHMADDPATEVDEAHGFMPHYELHVWTARENPKGLYAEFNPAVRCPMPKHDAAPAAGHGAHATAETETGAADAP